MIDNAKQSSKVAWQRFRRRQKLRAFQFCVDARAELYWRLYGSRKYTLEKLASQASQHRWCFVVGCNNSGTTLVSDILQNTRGVSGFVYEGQRYTRALTRAARKGHERVWSEFLDELRLTEMDSRDNAPRLLHDWTLALKHPIESLIVEKSTCNAVRMRWLQEIFPNSVFIAMVRDGYSVVEGSYRKGEKDIARAARHWNLVNKLIVEDSSRLRNFYLLKYEDLVGQNAVVVKNLAALLELPESDLTTALEGEYGFNTLNGLGPQSIKDFNAASRARLNDRDIKTIRTEAKEMLDHFHYEI